ncbi:MAG: flagellar protein FliL [Moorella sp. (in: firmicutes)]|jgi:flagellar FliL protein|uniref:flagellar basal body-associated FliL family protein n=1 Tax=Moorella sp. E308F TaxID=2572682 RepID=UPI0010FFBEEE|nr:flagellar basal body-associated FliL family protein [Moorella sp. E308F]MDK2816023.1 flagellar protein FliL [Moorella sp. (in: firmicutes)]MDK2894799.1 flagellar protein FliL [Moorella sp. (in: firmicutes)]GEA16658.1 flagellar basal body-associated protein FliL [Moorella sp. E308F]
MPPRDEAEKKEKQGRPWLTIALLLVILLLSGGYFYYFFFGGSKGVTAAAPAGKQASVIMQKMSLEPIVVNLADPGLRRYLRAKITLEYSDARLTTELNEKLYRIRDTLISVLRSKKTDDLQNEDALKRELLTAINAQLIGGQVQGLYFEEFIIQ